MRAVIQFPHRMKNTSAVFNKQKEKKILNIFAAFPPKGLKKKKERKEDWLKKKRFHFISLGRGFFISKRRFVSQKSVDSSLIESPQSYRTGSAGKGNSFCDSKIKLCFRNRNHLKMTGNPRAEMKLEQETGHTRADNGNIGCGYATRTGF